MKAEDTVMSFDEMKQAGGYDPLKQAYVTPIDIVNIQLNIAKAQAEISFDAGCDLGYDNAIEKLIDDKK